MNLLHETPYGTNKNVIKQNAALPPPSRQRGKTNTSPLIKSLFAITCIRTGYYRSRRFWSKWNWTHNRSNKKKLPLFLFFNKLQLPVTCVGHPIRNPSYLFFLKRCFHNNYFFCYETQSIRSHVIKTQQSMENHNI